MLTELGEQIGFLAQGLGADDWVNLLFIVVMAVLWLVAGLVKAMSKKKSQQEPPALDGLGGQRRPVGESWQQRLARRAEELQRRLEEEAGLRESQRSQPASKTPARPAEASGGKITVRQGQRGDSVIVYERPQAQPPMPQEPELARQRQMREAMAAAAKGPVGPELKPVAQQAAEPMLGSLTSLTAQPPQPLNAGEVQAEGQRESHGSASGMVIDYGDPEALRNAILSYEILGMPLGLRETLDQTWVS